MESTKYYPVPEELAVQIPGYLERRFQDLSEIEHYYEMRNWNGVCAVAHKIKGNGAAFGFQELTDIAEDIQRAAGTNDDMMIRQAINTLKVELFYIEEFLEESLND